MIQVKCILTGVVCPYFIKANETINTERCGDKCEGVYFEDVEDVKHPAHYAYSKYEPVKVIREWNLNFNLGNVIKYVARAGRKDNIVQDLKKARQYLDFEIEALENETTI